MDQGIPLNTDSTLKGQTVFLAERCAELIQTILLQIELYLMLWHLLNAKSIPYQDKEAFENMLVNLLENMIIYFIYLLME